MKINSDARTISITTSTGLLVQIEETLDGRVVIFVQGKQPFVVSTNGGLASPALARPPLAFSEQAIQVLSQLACSPRRFQMWTLRLIREEPASTAPTTDASEGSGPKRGSVGSKRQTRVRAE